MIDNVILNSLANRNLTPCQLMKKRAENKRLTISTSNSQLKEQHSGYSRIGQPQTLITNQSCSNQPEIQSALSQKPFQRLQNQKVLSIT